MKRSLLGILCALLIPAGSPSFGFTAEAVTGASIPTGIGWAETISYEAGQMVTGDIMLELTDETKFYDAAGDRCDRSLFHDAMAVRYLIDDDYQVLALWLTSGKEGEKYRPEGSAADSSSGRRHGGAESFSPDAADVLEESGLTFENGVWTN